jgi:hypothetical protein
MVVLPTLIRARQQRTARRRARAVAELARREHRALARTLHAFINGR